MVSCVQCGRKRIDGRLESQTADSGEERYCYPPAEI